MKSACDRAKKMWRRYIESFLNSWLFKITKKYPVIQIFKNCWYESEWITFSLYASDFSLFNFSSKQKGRGRWCAISIAEERIEACTYYILLISLLGLNPDEEIRIQPWRLDIRRPISYGRTSQNTKWSSASS